MPWIGFIFYFAMMLWPRPGLTAPLGPASGERLTYNIHWLGIPGGRAVMAFHQEGEQRYRIRVTLESTGAVALIHTIRDRFEALGLLGAGGPRTCRFVKDQQTGKKHRHTELLFHRQQGDVERLDQDGLVEERLSQLAEGENDPLTAIYGLRMHPDLKPGARFDQALIDGRKRYLAHVTVADGGRLAGPLGWFDVLEVSPTLESSELFRHAGHMTIWLTSDARRLPVRVQSKVRVGSVQADLMAYDDGHGHHQEFSPFAKGKELP